MKNLIEDVSMNSGITYSQAEIAIGATLGFLASRLPSPVMGRIREALASNPEFCKTDIISKGLGNVAD